MFSTFARGRGSHRRVVAHALLAIAAVTIVVLGLGCGSSSSRQGSGNPASQSRALPPFSSLELAGSNNVTIHVGARQSVVVHADRNLLDRVTTRVRAGRLMIANTPGSFTSRSPMSVEVTMPSLAALRLSGSGSIAADGVDSSTVTVTLPGSGNVSASGIANRLEVTVGGSGNAQLAGLASRDVHAVLNGSGTIFVRASSSLRASIPGSGAIFYLGHPTHVTTSVTGSGSILQGTDL